MLSVFLVHGERRTHKPSVGETLAPAPTALKIASERIVPTVNPYAVMLLWIWEMVRGEEKGFLSSTTDFACEEVVSGTLASAVHKALLRTRLSMTPVVARTVKFARIRASRTIQEACC